MNSPGNLLTTTLTFYDAAGQVQYSVDARGTVTQNQYDGAGRRTNVLVYTAYTFAPTSTGTPNPTGAYQSTSYVFDANGNQVTVALNSRPRGRPGASGVASAGPGQSSVTSPGSRSFSSSDVANSTCSAKARSSIEEE